MYLKKRNSTERITCIFLHVNGVKKPVSYYTLDVIISVGYRVHRYETDIMIAISGF